MMMMMMILMMMMSVVAVWSNDERVELLPPAELCSLKHTDF